MIARGGLLSFIEAAWSSVVPAKPFKDNWHLGEICAHLEAISAGEIRNLIINIPPGCSKSLSTAVFWPAWEWAEVDASRQYIFATYSSTLSRRDAIRMRNLIETDWFQQRWPKIRIPYQNTRSATYFANNQGGLRMSTSIKGGVTGHHADTIGVDDPLKPLDAEGRRAILGTEIEAVIDWWTGTMSTRQADPSRTRRVITMQRLNERDLCGHVLEEETEEQWVHLRLPMEFETKFPCRTAPLLKRYKTEDPAEPVIEPGGDQRTEEGELLWPAHYGPQEVATLKRKLGPRSIASQLQQRPSPVGGAIFKSEWFQYWGYPGSKFEQLPERMRQIQSWDFTFKGKPTGGGRRSYVSGQCWGQSGSDFFLLDQERGQWEFVESCHAVMRLTKRWPKAIQKLFEDAANGPAIKSALQKRVIGIKLVPTSGGSMARAQAVSPLYEAGNIWLPHPSVAPWIVDYVAEVLAFPNGANDDQVDSSSHALVQLSAGISQAYKQAMEQIGA